MTSDSPVAGVSGAIRIKRLSGPSLAGAEAHGKRLDHAGKARSVVKNAPPLTTTGLELKRLHADHVDGAQRRKGAPEGLHMLLQFPKDLVDGENAQAMLDHARAFAETIFGDAAIFADRVDRDEKSRHVVDLFLAPKYQKVTKRGSKTAVTTSNHLKKLAADRNKAPTLRGQGQALQDAWFDYLRDQMRLDVKRGAKKALPGEDWQTPEDLELKRLRKKQKRLKDELTKLQECTDAAQSDYETLVEQGLAEGREQAQKEAQEAQEVARMILTGQLPGTSMTESAKDVREAATKIAETERHEIELRRISPYAKRQSSVWRDAKDKYRDRLPEGAWLEAHNEVKTAHEDGKEMLDSLPTGGPLLSRAQNLASTLAAYWNGIGAAFSKLFNVRSTNDADVAYGVLNDLLPHPVNEYVYLQPLRREAEIELATHDLVEKLRPSSGPSQL